MGSRFFSDKARPVHLGPYPLERLARRDTPADLSAVPAMQPLSFRRSDAPESIVNAMGEYQAMMDALRDGLVNKVRAGIPDDPRERSNHLKAFGYFNDASMVGICAFPGSAMLKTPIHNPDIDRLAQDLSTRQTKTLAAGIDVIMAELKESMEAPPSTIVDHSHAIMFLYENPRDIRKDEPGTDWLHDALAHRACLRATETACVIANYIRTLGFDAKGHSPAASDVDLNKLAVAAGLATVEEGVLVAPYLGTSFGVAAVTCALDLATDAPLAPMSEQPWFNTKGPGWWLGVGHAKNALNRDPFARRDFALGPHPFEKLKRVESPTTFIDEARVARVPKRADMFARAQFGDMGKPLQDAAKGGYYARQSRALLCAASRAGRLCGDSEWRSRPQRPPPHRSCAQL